MAKPQKTTANPQGADGIKTQSYAVKSVIHHDGDIYDVGESIDLTDKQAAALLVCGAIAAAAAIAAPGDSE